MFTIFFQQFQLVHTHQRQYGVETHLVSRDVSYPGRSNSQTDGETPSLPYKNYCMTKPMDTDECIWRQYWTGRSSTGTDWLTKTARRTTKPQSRQNDMGTSKWQRHGTGQSFRQELNDTGVAQTWHWTTQGNTKDIIVFPHKTNPGHTH